MRRPCNALDWMIRGKKRRSGKNKTTAKCEERTPDAPDWITWGGTGSRSQPPRTGSSGDKWQPDNLDWINRDRTSGGGLHEIGKGSVRAVIASEGYLSDDEFRLHDMHVHDHVL